MKSFVLIVGDGLSMSLSMSMSMSLIGSVECCINTCGGCRVSAGAVLVWHSGNFNCTCGIGIGIGIGWDAHFHFVWI